jgi:hypothetical protein
MKIAVYLTVEVDASSFETEYGVTDPQSVRAMVRSDARELLEDHLRSTVDDRAEVDVRGW